MDEFLDQALEEFEEEEAREQERENALLDSILNDAMDEFEDEVTREQGGCASANAVGESADKFFPVTASDNSTPVSQHKKQGGEARQRAWTLGSRALARQQRSALRRANDDASLNLNSTLQLTHVLGDEALSCGSKGRRKSRKHRIMEMAPQQALQLKNDLENLQQLKDEADVVEGDSFGYDLHSIDSSDARGGVEARRDGSRAAVPESTTSFGGKSGGGTKIVHELNVISAEVSTSLRAVEDLEQRRRELKRQLAEVQRANRLRPRSASRREEGGEEAQREGEDQRSGGERSRREQDPVGGEEKSNHDGGGGDRPRSPSLIGGARDDNHHPSVGAHDEAPRRRHHHRHESEEPPSVATRTHQRGVSALMAAVGITSAPTSKPGPRTPPDASGGSRGCAASDGDNEREEEHEQGGGRGRQVSAEARVLEAKTAATVSMAAAEQEKIVETKNGKKRRDSKRLRETFARQLKEMKHHHKGRKLATSTTTKGESMATPEDQRAPTSHPPSMPNRDVFPSSSSSSISCVEPQAFEGGHAASLLAQLDHLDPLLSEAQSVLGALSKRRTDLLTIANSPATTAASTLKISTDSRTGLGKNSTKEARFGSKTSSTTRAEKEERDDDGSSALSSPSSLAGVARLENGDLPPPPPVEATTTRRAGGAGGAGAIDEVAQATRFKLKLDLSSVTGGGGGARRRRRVAWASPRHPAGSEHDDDDASTLTLSSTSSSSVARTAESSAAAASGDVPPSGPQGARTRESSPRPLQPLLQEKRSRELRQAMRKTQRVVQGMFGMQPEDEQTSCRGEGEVMGTGNGTHARSGDVHKNSSSADGDSVSKNALARAAAASWRSSSTSALDGIFIKKLSGARQEATVGGDKDDNDDHAAKAFNGDIEAFEGEGEDGGWVNTSKLRGGVADEKKGKTITRRPQLAGLGKSRLKVEEEEDADPSSDDDVHPSAVGTTEVGGDAHSLTEVDGEGHTAATNAARDEGGESKWHALAESLSVSVPAHFLAKQKKAEARAKERRQIRRAQRGGLNLKVRFATDENEAKGDTNEIHDSSGGRGSPRDILKSTNAAPLAGGTGEDSTHPATTAEKAGVPSAHPPPPFVEHLWSDDDSDPTRARHLPAGQGGDGSEERLQRDGSSLAENLQQLEESAVGSDLHALWRGALPAERDWHLLTVELPPDALTEIEHEAQVFTMISEHGAFESLELLKLALSTPSRMKEFAIAAHAFVRWWGPRRDLFVEDTAFRSHKDASEVVVLLCCALRDCHVSYLPAVLAVLYLFSLHPNHRRTVLFDGGVGAVLKRLKTSPGSAAAAPTAAAAAAGVKSRTLRLTALTLLCSVLWGKAGTTPSLRGRQGEPKAATAAAAALGGDGGRRIAIQQQEQVQSERLNERSGHSRGTMTPKGQGADNEEEQEEDCLKAPGANPNALKHEQLQHEHQHPQSHSANQEALEAAEALAKETRKKKKEKEAQSEPVADNSSTLRSRDDLDVVHRTDKPAPALHRHRHRLENDPTKDDRIEDKGTPPLEGHSRSRLRKRQEKGEKRRSKSPSSERRHSGATPPLPLAAGVASAALFPDDVTQCALSSGGDGCGDNTDDDADGAIVVAMDNNNNYHLKREEGGASREFVGISDSIKEDEDSDDEEEVLRAAEEKRLSEVAARQKRREEALAALLQVDTRDLSLQGGGGVPEKSSTGDALSDDGWRGKDSAAASSLLSALLTTKKTRSQTPAAGKKKTMLTAFWPTSSTSSSSTSSSFTTMSSTPVDLEPSGAPAKSSTTTMTTSTGIGSSETAPELHEDDAEEPAASSSSTSKSGRDARLVVSELVAESAAFAASEARVKKPKQRQPQRNTDHGSQRDVGESRSSSATAANDRAERRARRQKSKRRGEGGAKTTA